MIKNKFRVMAAIAVLLPSSVMAIDCTRPIEKVFVGSGTDLWIAYSDGYNPATMKLSDIQNEKTIDRTLSVVLAGFMAGRNVVSRYSEGLDGSPASCTPTATQKLIGAWVK